MANGIIKPTLPDAFKVIARLETIARRYQRQYQRRQADNDMAPQGLRHDRLPDSRAWAVKALSSKREYGDSEKEQILRIKIRVQSDASGDDHRSTVCVS